MASVFTPEQIKKKKPVYTPKEMVWDFGNEVLNLYRTKIYQMK
jgi:ligand-binding SRPBCC domain-containing protein